jgi:hypothetical protein
MVLIIDIYEIKTDQWWVLTKLVDVFQLYLLLAQGTYASAVTLTLSDVILAHLVPTFSLTKIKYSAKAHGSIWCSFAYLEINVASLVLAQTKILLSLAPWALRRAKEGTVFCHFRWQDHKLCQCKYNFRLSQNLMSIQKLIWKVFFAKCGKTFEFQLTIFSAKLEGFFPFHSLLHQSTTFRK